MGDLDNLFNQLDDVLRQRAIRSGGKEAEALANRKSHLSEMRKALESLFRSSCPSGRLKMYRPLIESYEADRDDLPAAVRGLLKPDDPSSFRSRIGFVRVSLATAVAPSLRGFVGHIVGVVFEGADRFVILIFATLDMDIGSLAPLEGTLYRAEVVDLDSLRNRQRTVADAMAVGLAQIIQYLQEEPI